MLSCPTITCAALRLEDYQTQQCHSSVTAGTNAISQVDVRKVAEPSSQYWAQEHGVTNNKPIGIPRGIVVEILPGCPFVSALLLNEVVKSTNRSVTRLEKSHCPNKTHTIK